MQSAGGDRVLRIRHGGSGCAPVRLGAVVSASVIAMAYFLGSTLASLLPLPEVETGGR